MGKQSKSGRTSKKNLSKNAAWLEERLEGDLLDLEALSAMPIDEVKAELKPFKINQKAFLDSLNEKLPHGASISVSTASRKIRKKTMAARAGDRKALPASPVVRRSSRIFGLRGALIVSVLVIASAIFLPRLIHDLRADRYKTATAIEDSTPTEPSPPTWIEGPAVNELIRGVKYTIEGLEQDVVKAPLPENPGTLTAVFKARATINGNGKIVRLEPLTSESTEFGSVVIDSLLQWKFSTLSDSNQLSVAVITVEYLPE